VEQNMRYLVGFISIIGVAAAIWMLQPAGETIGATKQARTPVVRITEMPLPSQSTVQAGIPLSEHDSVKSHQEDEAR